MSVGPASVCTDLSGGPASGQQCDYWVCLFLDDDGYFEYNYVRGLSESVVHVQTITTSVTAQR